MNQFVYYLTLSSGGVDGPKYLALSPANRATHAAKMLKPLQSKTTFQIKRLPVEMTASEFEREIAKLARNAGPQKCKAWQFKFGLAVSTVAGEKILVGTVSCPSDKIKEEMMSQAKLRRVVGSPWKDIVVEDLFPALTILYTPLDFSSPMAE